MSVLVEPGVVTVVTIDRPDVHNAFDTSTADALESAVREFDRDESARVLVLTGAGNAADARCLPAMRCIEAAYRRYSRAKRGHSQGLVSR